MLRKKSMSWVCPHCNFAAVLRDDDIIKSKIVLDSSEGFYGYELHGTKCPNPSCHKATVTLAIREMTNFAGVVTPLSKPARTIPILPSKLVNKTKSYPDYIPSAIRQDYAEACAIMELSPKSSATLARRALQGMIRDYWGVKEDNLSHAIKAIEDKVTPDIWDAIDGVRKVGNIGAHMEKDINLIIDVSPQEAELLINMVEMLFEDWYEARYNKQQRVLKMKELSDAKALAKKSGNNNSPN